jgi:hypothetical protein
VSGIADHVLRFGDHFAGPERLCEEAAVGRTTFAGAICPDARMILIGGQRS